MPYQELLSGEFHGAVDAWTEYLCLQVLADGTVQLTSRSREALAGYGWEEGPAVYPAGYDPNAIDDEEVLPLTIGGKEVWGRSGEIIVGHDLVPHSDDSIATFRPGEVAAAREWLDSYGWSDKPAFDSAWTVIAAHLSRRTPAM